MQISRQTRVVFGQKIKCLGFLRRPVRFSVRNLKCRFWGKNGDFLVKFLPRVEFGWNVRTVRTMVFFRTDFRTFRAFSHDFRTTCFLKVFFFARIFARFEGFFFCTDFRAFSHDFRTTCFFKVFCSHFSHDLRTQAVGQRVCARFDRNLHKSGEKITRFDRHAPKFLSFYKEKPWPIENEHIGMFWLFVQLILC